MGKKADLSSGWKTYEVCESDSEGEVTRTPFSDELVKSGKIPVQAITKMRMLEELGWPTAKRQLKDNHGHPLVVKKDERIWLLKCKPACWRLYFYVHESSKSKCFIFVHAVCKKADQEDDGDTREARRIADQIRPGGSRITEFEFPAR